MYVYSFCRFSLLGAVSICVERRRLMWRKLFVYSEE